MVFKILILVMLLAIVASMAVALFGLTKHDPDSTRTVKALTVRIVLSIVLLILIVLGYWAGLISPNQINF
ncbi:MAG TPA: twin transmembrane helix small protein [Chromatiales bacterium]|nr:twin transmembrane helix small protein [Chromatiales bacterium]